MGNSFFRKAMALGALALLPEVAHAENAASNGLEKANRAIVDARNNTKRALSDTGDKINNDIVNAWNKTKQALKRTDTKVNNEVIDAQHKVKGTARDATDGTNHRSSVPRSPE